MTEEAGKLGWVVYWYAPGGDLRLHGYKLWDSAEAEMRELSSIHPDKTIYMAEVWAAMTKSRASALYKHGQMMMHEPAPHPIWSPGPGASPAVTRSPLLELLEIADRTEHEAVRKVALQAAIKIVNPMQST